VLLALWALSIRNVDPSQMNDFGLMSVLPATSVILLLALTASFAVALARGPVWWVALAHVVVLLVMLFGITALVEPEPRFQAVWKHVGIIDYIDRHGAVDPAIDAYFNWPSFFVLGDVITDAIGSSSPALAMVAWAPLVFNLLYLPPLFVILRSATPDPRVSWLGVWIFYSCNWVGQDYFSPQAVAFLIWLSIAAIVLSALVRLPDDRAAHLQRGAFVPVVVLMFAAVVTGHQLTPFAALLGLGALAIFTPLVARGFVWLLALVLGAWIAYMTTSYLAGNIHTLTHPLGSLGSNLDANIGRRLAGSPEHTLVGQLRIIFSAALWALAVAGFLLQRHRWRRTLPVALLAVSPFVLPALQPYGGEILLRVFLFSLPGVAFFAAHLAFPLPSSGHDWRTTVAVAAVLGAGVLTFQFARHGNERLDFYTRGDVATVQALYKAAPRHSALFAANYNLPWRYRDYADYGYRELADLDAWGRNSDASHSILKEIRTEAGGRPAYVIVTRSTRVAADMLFGTRRSLSKLVASLHRSRAAREIYHAGGGYIFRVDPARGSP
jgi:hypothetical protein